MNHKITSQQGSVRQKGKQWYYRFRMEEPDGTWKLHEVKGGKTKRETEAMLREALDDYRKHGTIYDPGNITVSELADLWYESEIEHSALTTNGRNDYKNAIRHIKAHPFGKTKLKNLTCEQIQAYVDEKYYGKFDEAGNQLTRAYSESTMRSHFVVLNGMFKFAVYPKRIMRENLMQYIKKRRKEKAVNLFGEAETQKIHTITKDEYNMIIQSLMSQADHKQYALPIQIAYYTGLRAGEVCALTWDDINLEEQYLTVRRNMYYDDDNKCWEVKVPKNGKSREVDFGATLTRILKAAKKEQLENQMRYGEHYHKHYYQMTEIKGRKHCQIYTLFPDDKSVVGSRVTKGKLLTSSEITPEMSEIRFVCSKEDGELMTNQTLKWCNKVVQRNVPNMKHFHFHALRHTYASTLVNNGANVKDVQELLGHSDIKITLNTYSHVTSRSRKRAVNILEQAISQ